MQSLCSKKSERNVQTVCGSSWTWPLAMGPILDVQLTALEGCSTKLSASRTTIEDVLRSLESTIEFRSARVTAYNFNWLAERKIFSIQDKMDKKNERIHSFGLQTLCKLAENKLNNLPLGYSFERDATTSPLFKQMSVRIIEASEIIYIVLAFKRYWCLV